MLGDLGQFAGTELDLSVGFGFDGGFVVGIVSLELDVVLLVLEIVDLTEVEEIKPGVEVFNGRLVTLATMEVEVILPLIDDVVKFPFEVKVDENPAVVLNPWVVFSPTVVETFPGLFEEILGVELWGIEVPLLMVVALFTKFLVKFWGGVEGSLDGEEVVELIIAEELLEELDEEKPKDDELLEAEELLEDEELLVEFLTGASLTRFFGVVDPVFGEVPPTLVESLRLILGVEEVTAFLIEVESLPFDLGVEDPLTVEVSLPLLLDKDGAEPPLLGVVLVDSLPVTPEVVSVESLMILVAFLSVIVVTIVTFPVVWDDFPGDVVAPLPVVKIDEGWPLIEEVAADSLVAIFDDVIKPFVVVVFEIFPFVEFLVVANCPLAISKRVN